MLKVITVTPIPRAVEEIPSLASMDSFELLLGDIRDAGVLFRIREGMVYIDLPAAKEVPWEEER